MPLDKNPGVHPIGVGEVLYRIVGRAIMRIVRRDLHYAAGSSQLCVGQIGGYEAAVATCNDSEADISSSVDRVLVDAIYTNAFNELNRQVTLHNIEAICPVLASILITTYCQDAFLLLEVILSFQMRVRLKVISSPWPRALCFQSFTFN